MSDIDFHAHCPICASTAIGHPGDLTHLMRCVPCYLCTTVKNFRALQDLRAREARLASYAAVIDATDDGDPTCWGRVQLADIEVVHAYRAACQKAEERTNP